MFKKNKTTQKSSQDPKKTLSRYQRFGLFFFSRVRITLLLWVLLASFGAACYTTLMKREGFPDIAAPYSIISGTYFVNNKDQIDREIALPLSKAIEKVNGVKKVSSQAGDNFFSTQIEFEEKLKSEEGSQRVQRAIEAQHILPAGVDAQFKPLYVTKLTLDGDDLLISIASKNLSTEELQQKAESVARVLGEGGSAHIEGAERIRTIDTFRRGVDPATGQQISEQQGFDWLGLPKDKGIDFYRSVIVAVKAGQGVDVLHLDSATQNSLEKVRRDPQFADLRIEIAADFAQNIRGQISSLQENLMGGLIAVLVISFLLISLRASLITALSMATVLSITVGLLYVFGLSLNTITLFSLILCLGLIVDDTTIMVEAIDKGRRSGAKPREVVATAIKKVALASTAGTLMTMMGFAPLLFISGIMGSFIHAIPITIIISLAVSLLVSITLIPFLARFTLLRGKPKQLSNPISKLESATAHALAQLVRRVGQSRKQGIFIALGAIGISLLMFIGGVFFAGKMQFNIFPPTKDSDVLAMELMFDGNSITDAEKTSAAANKIVADTLGSYVKRLSYQSSGSDTTARATIDLVSFKDREPTSPELSKQLERQFKGFTGAQVKVSAEGGPAPTSGFALQITSEDGAKSTQLAQTIQAFLMNKELTRTDGTTAHVNRVTLDGDRSIQRSEGKRYVQIDASFDANDTSALVALTQQAVKREFDAARLQDFALTSSALNFDVGQEAENQESFKSMIIAFPILLLAMYIMLALQFRSISQPLMIFLAIPFSFFGVTAGLYFTDNYFSFFAMLGIFALLGIAVNNTILLTDYANQARKEGARRTEAVASALEERFRPLLTTSLTSVVALIPLALSDPFWEGLSITLIFGLLSSTFLVVVAFPYYFLANELIRMKFNRTRVLQWLGILILASILLGQVAAKLVGPFIMGYLVITFGYIAARALRRRFGKKAVDA